MGLMPPCYPVNNFKVCTQSTNPTQVVYPTWHKNMSFQKRSSKPIAYTGTKETNPNTGIKTGTSKPKDIIIQNTHKLTLGLVILYYVSDLKRTGLIQLATFSK